MIDYMLYGSWSCTHPNNPRKVSAIFKSRIPFLPPKEFAITVCEQITVPPLFVVDLSWSHVRSVLEIQAAFTSPEDFLPGVIQWLDKGGISYAVEG